MRQHFAESDFLDTFEVELAQGRFFSPAPPSQSTDAVITESWPPSSEGRM